jgi:ABC-type antimicrobial peptide transport system permease subunit
LIGAIVGLAGAAALTRVMGTLLFGVQGADAVALASVAVLFIVTALVASYLPARRAASIDPMASIRAN